ncbi:S8 family serine peptidase [Mycoplasma hafezii]|uniref:S8 family serine peptidase n=1 Tax=Mycoplasma hafezii TaxID=525886 RepID=UPI003CE7F643
MKLYKILKIVAFLAPLSIPIIIVSASSSTNNYRNFVLQELKNTFQVYYQKLGINITDRKNQITSFNTNFNKVGILELSNKKFDEYLYSSNQTFKINYLNSTDINKEKITEKDIHSMESDSPNHPIAVSSIIGTDLGINRNANIYYAKAPNKKQNLLNIFSQFKSNGVNIVNISLGQNFSFLNKWKNSFNWDELRKIMNDKDLNKLFEIIWFIKLTEKLENRKTEDTLWDVELTNAIDEFCEKNNMIFVVSANNNFDTYLQLKEFLKNIKNNFSEYASISRIYLHPNYIHWTKNNVFLQILSKLTDDNFKKINQLFAYGDSSTIDESINTLIRNIRKTFNEKRSEKAIYVGAVNYDNKPTSFTAYDDEHDLNPLVSAYGEGLKIDDQLIESKKGYEYTRKFARDKAYEFWNNSLQKTDYNRQTLELLNYVIHFNGTSMAAPMVSGLLSLFQTEFKHELTINEAKALLVASATYGNTKVVHNKIDDLENSNNIEWWKNNHAKSKTGYGIPKYFKMRKIYNNTDGYRIINLNDKNSKLSQKMDGDHTVSIPVNLNQKNNIRWVKITTTFNNLNINKFFDYVNSQNNLSRYKNILSELIKQCKNSNSIHKNNFLDLFSKIEYSIDKFYTSERTKSSISYYSPVEKTIHKNNKSEKFGFSVKLILKQLSFITDQLNKLFENKKTLFGSNSIKQLETINSFKAILINNYKDFIDKTQNIYLVYEIIE